MEVTAVIQYIASIVNSAIGAFVFHDTIKRKIDGRFLMPRKNKRKIEPYRHAPSIYDHGFKPQCCGCAFAGQGAVCLTSDGRCLKVRTPDEKEVHSNTPAERRTNTASPQRRLA